MRWSTSVASVLWLVLVTLVGCPSQQARVKGAGASLTTRPSPPRQAKALASVKPAVLSFKGMPLDLDKWKLTHPKQIQSGRIGLLQKMRSRKIRIYRLHKFKPASRSQLIRRDKGKRMLPRFEGNCFLVSHFEHSPINRLGGLFNRYQRAPSSANATVKQHPDGHWSLHLRVQKKAKGFAGMWMHLFRSTDPAWKRRYLDTRQFKVLTFWARSQSPGADLQLKVADKKWTYKGDAMPIGSLRRFLPKGHFDHKWRRVVIPLDKLPSSLDRSRLASVVFDAQKTGDIQLDFKTMSFCKTATSLPPLPKPLALSQKQRPYQRAIWVWNTKQILSSEPQQQKLLAFLLRHRFNRVFLQLPALRQARPSAESIQLFTPKLRRLIRRLSVKGIRVDALDGEKHYALPSQHEKVLGIVKAVLEYNQKSRASERFRGFHFDIEPYLLTGFWSKRRHWIMRQYLTLLSRIKPLAHANKMTLGVDIPFWFDAIGPFTQALYRVKFQGKEKVISHHVIDVVDVVGLMDYRTVVYGADGILAHAHQELRYATKKKKQMFVALETHELPDEYLFTFVSQPQKGLPPASSKSPHYLFALPKDTPKRWTMYLLQRKQLSAWQRFVAQFPVQKRKQMLYWPVRQQTMVPADKLSYARMGQAKLRHSLRKAQRVFEHYPAFQGFALHHYQSLQQIFEAPPTQRKVP